MSCGDFYPPKGYWPVPTYPTVPPNYCPTCGKPWYGGWYQSHQPQFWCKTDNTKS